jgi:hypothetical protein
LAQAYSEWTGDEDVPANFVIIDVEGILPTRIIGQPLRRIKETVLLLRALNAPFTTVPITNKPTELMEKFLSNYIQSIQIPKDISSSEQTLFNQLITNMHHALHSKEFPNPFDFYFEKLVPYVKACKEEWTLLEPVNELNMAKELLLLFRQSYEIRQNFSAYSIPFDVIHVMLGCYVCCCDLNVVANWALDLMSRVCDGKFFWKRFESCRFVQAMERLLKTEVTFKNRTDLYYVIRHIREGNSAECLSNFLPQYSQLERLVKEKFPNYYNASDIAEFASHQLFPAVLFENHNDQLGFSVGLGHVACSIHPRTGQVKKGTYSTARKIHRVISRFIESVQKFNQIPNLWTLDTLQQFLVQEPRLEKDILEIAKLVLSNDE